jgi:putative effector of murein hydrolase LrgA (UPF0299 family)
MYLLFVPSAIGLLFMAAVITVETWAGGRNWKP